MRILYDSQIFRIQKFGGVSRYCAELINGFSNNADFDVIPKRVYSSNSYLTALGYGKHRHFQKLKFPGKHKIESIIKKREDKQLENTIIQGDYEIYHPTYYYPTYLNSVRKNKPIIATIHDMTYELYYDKVFNKIHQESISKKELILRADHIIAVSQNTKNDILKIYPTINENSISVVYHGSSLRFDLKESSIDLPERYLLYVGKRGKYKNFAWMLDAIADFLVRNDIQLICAGGRSFSDEERHFIAEKKMADKIKYHNISSDEDLATMYKKAIGFIYPSSHEGFGIPILEAFSCGCPVLLAESSCFPEIGSDGALYFQNENKEQFLSQLGKIVEDNSLRKTLVQNGYKRLQEFSWQKTVQQHIDVYKKVSKTFVG